MPHFAVIHVKRSNRTPRQTEITFTFPDGQEVLYKADNILLREEGREEGRFIPKGQSILAEISIFRL